MTSSLPWRMAHRYSSAESPCTAQFKRMNGLMCTPTSPTFWKTCAPCKCFACIFALHQTSSHDFLSHYCIGVSASASQQAEPAMCCAGECCAVHRAAVQLQALVAGVVCVGAGRHDPVLPRLHCAGPQKAQLPEAMSVTPGIAISLTNGLSTLHIFIFF